jgi:hypothetical protein
MRNRDAQTQALNRAETVFCEVASRPGWEPVDEDTAGALVSAYAKELEAFEFSKARIKEIIRVIEKADSVDKDWILEVLQAPLVLGK